MPSDLLERPGSLVHRYYDPATEQFLSVDPAENVTGTFYAFSIGDPVNGSDAVGLQASPYGSQIPGVSDQLYASFELAAWKNPGATLAF
jgi:uncharacterized protein RhaS with RHS repeats